MKTFTLLALFLGTILFSSCKKEPGGFILSDTKLNLKVGERYQLSITKDGVKQKVEYFKWGSSDVTVGDVNGSAQAFGKGKGNFTIKVWLRETSALISTCEVTVTD